MKLCIFFLLCILGTVMCANNVSLKNRDKRFIVDTFRKAAEKIVDVAKKVVDKTKDLFQKIKDVYNKAKNAFKKLGGIFKSIDFDGAVDKVLGFIDSSFTQKMCISACEGGAGVIFSVVNIGDLKGKTQDACEPVCEGGLAKLEEKAQKALN